MNAFRRIAGIPLSFSLRTLLVVVTVLTLWLGYEMNWIHQRHSFLSEQLARHLTTEHTLSFQDGHTELRRIDPQLATEWWHEQLATDKPAPWSLQLFGETGVGKLWLVIPARDTTVRNWGQSGAGPFIGPALWKDISASQPDYQRAKQLFPEAELRPVAPDELIAERDGVGGSGWSHPGVTVQNGSRPTIVRLACDETVVENSVLNGRLELSAPLEGVAIVIWHTRDGTATSWWDKNYEESGDMILAAPNQKEFTFAIRIGALTAEQRAAGGAIFKIELRTVIGAFPEVNEKTITIVPAFK